MEEELEMELLAKSVTVSTRSSRKRRREVGWPEVVQCLVGLEKPQEVLDKMIESAFTPQMFMDIAELYRRHLAVMWGITGWETTLKECIKELFEKKPLPSPSNMRVEDLRLILHGGLPTIASDIATATFENEEMSEGVKELLEVMEKRMSNVTEMEAIGRILLYVLDAVRLKPVKIKLQPDLMDHPVFTDFLIFLIDSSSGDQIPKCLIEVKKSSLFTDLKLEVPSTAQALREAHIAITHYKLSEFPFILTNGISWSFGLAEASGEKIAVTQHIHFFVVARDMNSIKKLLYCLKCVAQGKWPKCK